MRHIAGKIVYDHLVEIANPRHTALLVVDMQNDFCSAEGIAAKGGADVRAVQAIVPHIQAVASAARNAGIKVIYMRHTHEPDLANLSPARLAFYGSLYGGSLTPYHCIRNSWGHDVIADLSPVSGDMVINKDRSSAFIATNLDLLLRSNRLETVVIVGMATHACVESTARDAGFFDYYAIVLRDCVADYSPDLHKASLLTMSHRCVLSTARELIPLWERSTNVKESAPGSA